MLAPIPARDVVDKGAHAGVDPVTPTKADDTLLFGISLARLTPTQSFLFLSFGALFCALTFAALQEKVFMIEGFKYSGFMTVLTTLTYMVCALIERWALNDMVRKGPWKEYAVLAVVTFLGMYLTNWSLSYLTYPTRVMFKSSKVIPVMLASVVIAKRRYSIGEYAAAFLLVVGITMFTLADKGLPTFNFLGVVLVLMGVVADAITCNYEETKFFHGHKCSQAEVVYYSSLLGLGFSVITLWGTGELFVALEHSFLHPEVYLYTFVFSAMGYGSVVFVLLLIKTSGSTNAEIVKSCRKVFTIVLSFLLYSKPVEQLHIIGGLVFIASVLISMKLKTDKKKKPSGAAGAKAEGGYVSVPVTDADANPTPSGPTSV